MNWLIRSLSNDDLNHIVEIAKEVLVPVWSPDEYGFFLRHPHALNRGVFDENEQLQCFILILHTAQELDIVSIATRKVSHGKGYASFLLESVLTSTPCERVVLEVDVENEPAVKLYLKNGFQVVGRRKKYYQQKRDAWIMAWQKIK